MKKIITLIIVLSFALSFAQNKKVDYSIFLGRKAKAVIAKEYKFSNLYDYKINAQKVDSLIVKPYNINIPEKALTDKYLDNLKVNKKDSIIFTVNLFSKLSIDINNKRYTFIKYRINNKELTEENQVFIAVKENNLWQEQIANTKELQLLESIMLYSSFSLLFKFFSHTDNPKYPEINKFKPLVKIYNSLEITKLEKVLRENESILKKYIEY